MECSSKIKVINENRLLNSDLKTLENKEDYKFFFSIKSKGTQALCKINCNFFATCDRLFREA